ncbi:MAG: tryptophan synthase subunit alpha [Candidatus Syntrophonatronum acetioxidans]|uniref:Tryptophan synthase alpha chain n=1 Tax=Candidatus Syntrophonatronum acetioxidans TaxID=1795816 RepID=A0A424YHM9_9FIRM|nr:MAG: tryptophan synthase subunit alpha [Candidatus Syntrophonatronum acetioxidans]
MRIKEKFETLKKKGEKALIPFIMAGDPDLETTEKLVLEMEKRGADIIELGLPFSDPLADGPVIQQSSQRALEKGTRTPHVFELVKRLREKTDIPLVILTYYNPLFSYGQEIFVKGAALAGVDGLVIPDLPLEERDELEEITRERGLDLICFLAPTSSQERIKKTARRAQGFIYCVSLTGVTGVREDFSTSAEKLIKNIRQHTFLPLALGFGISTPHQAGKAARYADGVIVGSALMKIIAQHGENRDMLVKEVGEFVGSLKRAVTDQFSDYRL